MNDQYNNLAKNIKRCSRCFLRDKKIDPIVPPNAPAPVKLMLVGENPSWEDNQAVPFDPATHSGRALDEYYLRPLALTRDDVWITDLFKCRYPRDKLNDKPGIESEIKTEVIPNCKLWLIEEIKLAQPKIIATLSNHQVYQRVRIAFSLDIPSDFEKAVGRPHEVEIEGYPAILFPLVHPYISRPIGVDDNQYPGPRKKWAPIHKEKHIPALISLLGQL